MYLLDTNACIDFLLAKSEPLTRRIGAEFGRLSISAITLAELLVGRRTSTDPDRDLKQLDRFVAGVNLMPFDDAAARAYGENVRVIGVKRNGFDRLIGTHALALGLTLVTHNTRDFRDIPDLKIEDWTL